MSLNETNQRLVELALSVKTLASNLETMHEDLRRTIGDQRVLQQRDFESLNRDLDRLARTISDSQVEIRRLGDDIRSRVGVPSMHITPVAGVPILSVDSSTPAAISPIPTSAISTSPIAAPSVTFKESGNIQFTLTPRMWQVIKWVGGVILTASGGAGIWELIKRIF